MADERQRRRRRGLANDRDEIGEIIFKLADIADVAARARRTVAADVDGEGFHAPRCQGPRQCVDGAAAGPGGTVHHDGRAPGGGTAGGVMAEAQPCAVPRLKPLDGGQGAEIDGAAGRGDGGKLGEARHRRGDQRGQQQRQGANGAEGPFH